MKQIEYEEQLASKNTDEKDEETQTEVTKKRKRKKNKDLVLGKMDKDVKFLEDFLKFHKPQHDIFGYQVFKDCQRLLHIQEQNT